MIGHNAIAALVFLLLSAGLAAYDAIAPDWNQLRRLRQIEAELTSRSRHIDCGELFDLMHNNQVKLILLDVRPEADFNLFHLVDARRVPAADLDAPWIKRLPVDAIKVLISNDERRADEAWTRLALGGIPGVYILEGGINRWLSVYGQSSEAARTPDNDDHLRHSFSMALGHRHPAANPDPLTTPRRTYTPKVKFLKPVTKTAAGCGG